MVLFATPGKLHGGYSLQVCRKWCTDPKNTIIVPGYCCPGTLGHKLVSGAAYLDRYIPIKCEV